MISVLPDDLQHCICLSWVHKQCLATNNNSVNNICDDTSYKYKNYFELFPFNDIDDDEFFYLHSNVVMDYFLDERRMQLFKHDYHENYEFDNNIDPNNFLALILIVNIIQNINLPRKLIKLRIFLLDPLTVEAHLLILRK